MLNRIEFIEIMNGLSGLYNITITEFTLGIYYDIFKDYDCESFRKAVIDCIKDRVYSSLPKPAEILQFLEGTRHDKALTAWLQAKEAVDKGGYYASIEFSDPIISHCLVQLGGWMEFCSQPINELPFIEKRFIDLYRLYLKREIKEPVKLIGYIEAFNNKAGHFDAIPAPIRIGFEQMRLPERII